MLKKVLIAVSAIIVVLLVGGAVYYFGYLATESEAVTQPEPAASPTSETEEPLVETPEVNEFKTLVISEGEINSVLSQVATSVAEAGLPAKLDYTRVRLVEDKMFLSVSGEARGIKLEAEDIEVGFQGTEISASGNATIGGLPVSFSFKAEINISNSKLTVDIETIDLGIVPFFVPQLRKDNLNQYLNQKLDENPFPLPLSELEEIKIEDGELIIKGR